MILAQLKEEDSQTKIFADSVIPTYRQFKSWAEEFDDASLEVKKMIACQLFSRVEVGKGYHIHIEMNMSYKQFVEDFEVEEFAM